MVSAWASETDPTRAERELLDRYVTYSEQADVHAVAELMHEELRFTMPPQPGAWTGREQVVQSWIDGGFGSEAFGAIRCLVIHANRQPAVACYVRRPGDDAHLPLAIDVLRIREGTIAEIVTFGSSVFPAFGLPPSI